MFAEHTSLPTRRGRRARGSSPADGNIQAARRGWGADLPQWVQLLASACDRTSQQSVAERLGRSSGYISRLINNQYPGDMAEAERLVRAAYAGDDVECPIWSATIPLSACMTNRRRKLPPRNAWQRKYLSVCPGCPHNTDTSAAEAQS